MTEFFEPENAVFIIRPMPNRAEEVIWPEIRDADGCEVVTFFFERVWMRDN